MDATRRRDGKYVMLKKVKPDEWLIAESFSSQEVARDPRNHCVPLLDVIEMPLNGQKLMVMPFLRPFNNPSFQTLDEFVAFFTQICEVGSFQHPSPRINLIELWIRVSNSCTSKISHTGTLGHLQIRCTV